jgi:hypothetical protein
VKLEPTGWEGKTPLFWVADNGHEVVKLLLEKGAKVPETIMA